MSRNLAHRALSACVALLATALLVLGVQPHAATAADGPTVSVSSSVFFDIDPSGETVTVTGTGFDPDANVSTRPPVPVGMPSGIYVVFGRFGATWQPSASAPSSARQVIDQKWALPLASKTAAETAFGPNAQYVVLEADGSFTTTLTIKEDDTKTGTYGIATYAAGGALANAEQETFTPITIVGAPAVSVSTSVFVDVDASGETVTVTGTGFDPDANVSTRPPVPVGMPTGVYVVFGRFGDEWRPSTGAPSSTRQVIDQKWALPLASKTAAETAFGPNAQYVVLEADGSFTTTLTIKEDDTKTGTYGIATYAAGGASANAEQETFTPIQFLVTPPVDPPAEPTAPPTFVEPVPGGRLLDTRAGSSTVDGAFAGQGVRPAGSTLELQVAGRGGVTEDASSVVLNLTATGSTGTGFVTMWPCDQPQPGTSSLNLAADTTVANAAIVEVGGSGTVCLSVAEADTHLIVDLAGVTGDGFGSVPPSRVVDTRTTPGAHPVGQVLTVPIAGLGEVPADAAAAVLNVTATDAVGPGYVTVWPCDAPQPNASNLNSVPGRAIAGAVVATLSADGTVCLAIGQSDAELIVDVVGFVSAGADYSGLVPARILDTRDGGSTIDGAAVGGGPVAGAGELAVIDRGGVPLDAAAVVVNVTADGAHGAGYVTVWNCDEPQPGTSTLNVNGPDPVANAAIVELSAAGTICLAVGETTADLIVDVAGVVGTVELT